MPDINYLAVLLAVVASMIVGFVFYMPAVFGRYWMRLVGHDEETMQGASPLVYPAVIVASFVTAWVLAAISFFVHAFYDGSFLLATLATALVLWLGFTVARLFVHDLFDTRGLKITVLASFNELLTVAAMAIIIGVWPPAGA